MFKVYLLSTLAVTASLGLSQASTTLPKGFDKTQGTSYFWSGFSVAPTTNLDYKYYTSRSVFLYDSSTFPWNPKSAKVIDKISFRRSHSNPAATAAAHKAKWVVIISTSNQPAHRPNTKFDDNHGSNKKVVFGAKGPQEVKFLATPQPKAFTTAPFDVTVDITNFLVLPNTKTLVIEIRSYSSDVRFGDWYVDSAIYPGTGYNGGGYTLFYSTHCLAPRAFYSARASYLNGHLAHIWRTGRKGGLPVIGLAGTRMTTGIKVPNTTCEWYINPMITAVTLTANGPGHATNPGQGTAYLDWGPIPPIASLVGIKVAHQALIIDPSANKLGIGITRGGETSIGTAYDNKYVNVGATYSFGPQNHRYNKFMDADKETYGRYFYRRVPIINIQ